MVEIVIALEITFGLLILIALSLHTLAKSSAATYARLSIVFMFYFFNFHLIDSAKVPFDLVEAESELIDGVTTEFEGYAFSLVYAGEIAIGFIGLKMFTYLSGYVILAFLALSLATFGGRILLSRFLISDFLELIFSTGLFLTVFFVAVVVAKQTRENF